MKAPVDEIRRALSEVMDRNIRERGELGASVSVWCGGEEIVSLARGFENRERSRDWTAETLVPVWSATKGPASLACLLALDDAGLNLESRVADVWPRFSRAGKDAVTFGQLLSHTAGLFALDREVSILDYPGVIAALEDQFPEIVSVGPAYHARTFGFLLDEIVRKISGADSLGAFFHGRLGAPLQLDFWIGLPSEQFSRVATLYPGRLEPAAAAADPFLRALGIRDTPTQRAFHSPTGLNSVREMNQSSTWSLGLPGFGGVGSATGLGKFYSILACNGIWQGAQVIPEWCLAAFSGTMIQGPDAVLCTETAFSAGMMRDPLDESGTKQRRFFGCTTESFGHPGAGGSLAWADPQRGLAFAYVMNQMETGALPGRRALELVAALDEFL
ncbi:MAG TPA: serine hydrolase domain-containing protein [Verrucomicrobiaceae bacterium]